MANISKYNEILITGRKSSLNIQSLSVLIKKTLMLMRVFNIMKIFDYFLLNTTLCDPSPAASQ